MRKVSVVSLFLLSVLVVWAQSEVAKVTSSSAFSLRSAAVDPSKGVANWPCLAGDSIKAGTAPTIITFNSDGSVVTLDPSSEGVVDFRGGKPSFRLVSGTAKYRLRAKTSVALSTPKGSLVPSDVAGVLGEAVPGAAGAGLSSGVVVGIVAVGAAAAVTGIAVATKGGSSVSGT
jgi:hypothetical protein